jgi:hypothetical protein
MSHHRVVRAVGCVFRVWAIVYWYSVGHLVVAMGGDVLTRMRITLSLHAFASKCSIRMVDVGVAQCMG